MYWSNISELSDDTRPRNCPPLSIILSYHSLLLSYIYYILFYITVCSVLSYIYINIYLVWLYFFFLFLLLHVICARCSSRKLKEFVDYYGAKRERERERRFGGYLSIAIKTFFFLSFTPFIYYIFLFLTF